MKHYEIVLLVHPDQDGNIDNIYAEFADLIKNAGGHVHRYENWGKRTLAYHIKKLSKAIYICLNIECSPESLGELEHYLKFNEKVIRFLVIKMKHAVTDSSCMVKALSK